VIITSEITTTYQYIAHSKLHMTVVTLTNLTKKGVVECQKSSREWAKFVHQNE